MRVTACGDKECDCGLLLVELTKDDMAVIKRWRLNGVRTDDFPPYRIKRVAVVRESKGMKASMFNYIHHRLLSTNQKDKKEVQDDIPIDVGEEKGV